MCLSMGSLFPWGGFAPLPLSDLLSCLSYVNCTDLFLRPFIHSEMPFCFLHHSHPPQHSKRVWTMGEKATILKGGAPGKGTLFSSDEKMKRASLPSFPGKKYFGKMSVFIGSHHFR